MRPAIYSGPNRTGICICGHSWDSHHLGLVMRADAVETDGGPEHYIPQECEAFGANENGGLDGEGKDHCFGYVDAAKEGE